MNSMGGTLPDLIRMMPRNLAYMNPTDLSALALVSGDQIEITSEHGTIQIPVEVDDSLRPGVVSVSHGFGGLPGEAESNGASTNLLISTDTGLQTINAMPRMTAIPVNIRRVQPEMPHEPERRTA